MKPKKLLIALFILINFATKAQYVVIPDSNFLTFLQPKFSNCITGNLMDTACVKDRSQNFFINLQFDVSSLNISDLTGIQYVTGLNGLWCQDNQLTSLPPLPPNLKKLTCERNQLTSLPSLPTTLEYLACNNNQLTSLPSLPASLTNLRCQKNQLTSLPSLPANIEQIECSDNDLISLPTLPNNLEYLLCNYNQLTSLPSLPSNLQYLECDNNQLTSLPSLPANLVGLLCRNNQLTSLPSLPPTLEYLACNNNQLTNLPGLPANLESLACTDNQLMSLPSLPPTLEYLACNNNQLASLPSLPTNLYNLWCESNNIACFPKFPDLMGYINISANPFNCLPNYIAAMDAITLTYPLCVIGDTLSNNANCAGAGGIVGYTYEDNNINCVKDNGDLSISNFPLNLYDSINNLLAQSYSLSNGIYNFAVASSSYKVEIDTVGMPFTLQCAYPGIDSTVVLSNGSPLASDVNFSITCKPGFDVGVQSVVPQGWVFPGQQHQLSVMAGDISKWYSLNCAAGVSGQVTITVTGNVSYDGIAPGSLAPSVAGNVFTYTIADFGTINSQLAFGLLFTTNTTAQAGDPICVNVTVSPVSGDNNPSNNTNQFCYHVVNSHDPNIKDVYPVNVSPGFQDWFTYTIHFQNTGSAPAFNIRLKDTLSEKLDLGTFQVINYSHYNTVALDRNLLTFRFPNIMLPDSTSNPEGSKGFVQYRIKPKGNLTIGTLIENTAYIYFDYNSPIVTNTTQNLFTTIDTEPADSNAEGVGVSVYPNPFGDNVTFVIQSERSNETYSLEIIDGLGKIVKKWEEITTKQFQISRDDLEAGIYFYKISNAEGIIGVGKVMVN